MDHEPSRRQYLRSLGGALGAGALGALAGCSNVPDANERDPQGPGPHAEPNEPAGWGVPPEDEEPAEGPEEYEGELETETVEIDGLTVEARDAFREHPELTPVPLHVDWSAATGTSVSNGEGAVEAGEDEQLVVVQFEVSNVGSRELAFGPAAFDVRALGAESPEETLVAADGLATTLDAEATVQGWAAFVAPAAAERVSLTARDPEEEAIVVDFSHAPELELQATVE